MNQAMLGVRLPGKEAERIRQLISQGYFMNAGDFLREAVRSKLGEFEFEVVREIDREKVKKEVLQYVKGHPHVYADEAATALHLDIETVIFTMESLIKEGKIGEST